MRIRSRKDVRCGERYDPVCTPSASSSASAKRTVEDLPLLPTTWMASNSRSGWPGTSSSACIRSRPNCMPNSSSDSMYLSADVTIYRILRPAPQARRGGCSGELGQAPFELLRFGGEPLRLLPLRVDELRGGPGDEALVLELRERTVALGDHRAKLLFQRGARLLDVLPHRHGGHRAHRTRLRLPPPPPRDESRPPRRPPEPAGRRTGTPPAPRRPPSHPRRPAAAPRTRAPSP